jgi:hypothetical protein
MSVPGGANARKPVLNKMAMRFGLFMKLAMLAVTASAANRVTLFHAMGLSES